MYIVEISVTCSKYTRTVNVLCNIHTSKEEEVILVTGNIFGGISNSVCVRERVSK